MTAKPISIKGAGCTFGGCVRKAVELTSGDLPLVQESGLRVERSVLSGRQKSAAGIVVRLLSNIVLDEFDRELERRGLRFARYADDSNTYVRSRRAGKRVMESMTRFITTKLKLKVNEQKSAVARPWERKFLGFSFTANREPKRGLRRKRCCGSKRGFGN